MTAADPQNPSPAAAEGAVLADRAPHYVLPRHSHLRNTSRQPAGTRGCYDIVPRRAPARKWT